MHVPKATNLRLLDGRKGHLHIAHTVLYIGCCLACNFDMQCLYFSLGVLQGDWGTQFGMLIQFLAEAGPGGLTDPAVADLELPQLQVRLVFCSWSQVLSTYGYVAACSPSKPLVSACGCTAVQLSL